MSNDVIYIKKSHKLSNIQDALKESDIQLQKGEIITELDGKDYSYHGSPSTETIYEIQGNDHQIYRVSDKDNLALTSKNQIEFIKVEEMNELTNHMIGQLNNDIAGLKDQIYALEKQKVNIVRNHYQISHSIVEEYPIPEDLIEKANKINSMDCGTRTAALFRDQAKSVVDYIHNPKTRDLAISNFHKMALKEITGITNDIINEENRITNWRHIRDINRTYASVIHDNYEKHGTDFASIKVDGLGAYSKEFLSELNEINHTLYGGVSYNEFEMANTTTNMHVSLNCYSTDLSGLKDNVIELSKAVQEKFNTTGKVPDISLSLKVNNHELISNQILNKDVMSKQLRTGKLNILDSLKDSVNNKAIQIQIDYLEQQLSESTFNISDTVPIVP